MSRKSHRRQFKLDLLRLEDRTVPANVVIDTVNLTITGDDGDPHTAWGTPFTAAVESGIARFYIRGNLTVPVDMVSATGGRPVSLIVGGNATIAAGAVFNFSANGQTPGPGGGAGGSGGASPTGGSGAPTLANSPGGPGGAGGAPHQAGAAGSNGLDGVQNLALPGPSGFLGAAGGSGFNNANASAFGGNRGTGGGNTQSTGGGGGGASGAGGAVGVAGGNGQHGTNGSTFYAAAAGSGAGPGLRGTNSVTGFNLSGGGGGGGGGSGGAGAGGNSGALGGSGGGGGGGGGEAIGFGSGGDGGAGGTGGTGGRGGDGGAGGAGGNGGGGGGAIEIVANGRLTVAGSFQARGSAGAAGAAGSTGMTGASGSAGGAGSPGQSGTVGGARGGDGGHGGNGATGATGGSGGSGGAGAGASGGTIKFVGTAVSSGGSSADTSGGGAGGNGRFLFGDNAGGAFNGTLTGAITAVDDGPRSSNPFLSPSGMTPFIAELLGGGDAYGITTLTSADFPSIVAGMHGGSALAMVLYDIGPGSYADDYTGYDMLLLVNLRNIPMPNPTLGSGAASFSRGLLTGGFANMPAFGGSGPQALTSLPANSVYTTLVPTGTMNFRATVDLFGNTQSVSATSFIYGVPVYLDVSPPRVQSVIVNDGAQQRSLVTSVTVTFNGLVSLPSNLAQVFTLTGSGNPGLAGTDQSTATRTIVQLTFTGPNLDFGSLMDGHYFLTTLSAQVHDGFGQALDGDGDGQPGGDAAATFFRFYGDVNGDQTVNGFDFGFFKNAFGTQQGDANYLSYLDLNGDGVINGFDFGQFRTRFGTTLP